MTLQPSPISSSQFNYHPGENLLTAEASDLRDLRQGRVYDDACDVGFTVVSARTGAARIFVMAREEFDREGDLLYVDFEMIPESKTGDAVADALRVRLYND
jgi:hypothetical protein